MRIWHFTCALSLTACLSAPAALGGEDAAPVFRHCGVKGGEPHCAQGISVQAMQAMGAPPPIPRHRPIPVHPGVGGGQAIVLFTITEDGRTADVKAVFVEPEGAAFGEAAERAVRRYLFERPKIDGQPVAVHEVATRMVFEA